MPEGSIDGERLMAVEPRLRLLFTHLAGPAVRARVGIDDLVQETYLRALRTAALPAADAELYRYLLTVARHCVVDAVRVIRAQKRAGREVALVHSDWSVYGIKVSDVCAETLGPLSRVVQVEETARLHAAFESLEADHRRVIGLRQFEGLSAKEAGQRMGRSETAVHSLFRRALQAWELAGRAALGGESGGDSGRASGGHSG